MNLDHTDLLLVDIINPNFYAQKSKGLKGLEIGGPSPQFNSRGIYRELASLDNINWNNKTIWNKNLDISYHYYDDRRGTNFIMEATNLKKIRSKTYDVILSSHSLEHIANPIKALKEWNRVTKDNGILILSVPKKEGMFDHNRPYTTFKHLLRDFELNVSENDMTHFKEIIELHDIEMDPWAGNYLKFIQRSLNNCNNRALHHHIFNEDLLKKIVNFAGYKIIKLDVEPYQYSLLARKNNK